MLNRLCSMSRPERELLSLSNMSIKDHPGRWNCGNLHWDITLIWHSGSRLFGYRQTVIAYGGEKWAEGKFSLIQIGMSCKSMIPELFRGIGEIIESLDQELFSWGLTLSTKLGLGCDNQCYVVLLCYCKWQQAKAKSMDGKPMRYEWETNTRHILHTNWDVFDAQSILFTLSLILSYVH